jgi:RNA polymerase sigma factor (sigma-70 family)
MDERMPEPTLDLAAIVLRAQSGDVDAFEILYRQHVGRIYALTRRMCADDAQADELTQEVFVKAWEKLDSYRGESAFSSWLHRVAVNVVLGDRRAEGRRLARVTPQADIEGTAPTCRPDLGVDLARALDTLPARARQVFVLHHVEGLGHEEVADAMGTSIGTSKGQLHRARELLRRVLS